MLKSLLKLSIPRSPTKLKRHLRITPEIDPEAFKDLYRYCMQDVRTEAAISAAIPELSEFELRVWQLDQEINERGVKVDAESIEACLRVVGAAEAKYASRLCELVGDSKVTVDKTAFLRQWVGDQGVDMPSFDKAAVEATLDIPEIPYNVREVLEIRQALGAKAIKKLHAMTRMRCRDGRIRGMFSYCGAGATGRWAGRGPQPQNLPNHGPAITRVDEALEDFRTLTLQEIEAKYGPALDTVGSTLRGLFIAEEGKVFMSSDYSAIEAVVLAELSEESWIQEEFQKPEPAYYEATAAMVSGVPLAEILQHKQDTGEHHPLRKLGKVAALASGFGGGVGAWKRFGADAFMTDDEIQRAINTWRRKSPAIVSVWHGLDRAAKAALLSRGQPFRYKYITYQVRGNVLYARLPSGRELTYHNPAIEAGKYGKVIGYDGWNSDSTKGPVGWLRREAWYGVLVENCCQAAARDILANALINLNAAGYPPVLHTHDEVVSEIPEGCGSVENFEFIMSIMPAWATGSKGAWPIKAKGGWSGKRYRKG